MGITIIEAITIYRCNTAITSTHCKNMFFIKNLFMKIGVRLISNENQTDL